MTLFELLPGFAQVLIIAALITFGLLCFVTVIAAVFSPSKRPPPQSPPKD